MKRLFLIGDPIAHSLSPAMHNAAFRAIGLDWQYELLETPIGNLRGAVARVRAHDCIGANVTIPHKETVIEFLDDIEQDARRLGSVNTLVKREGKLIGYSTDGYGFLQALRDANVDVQNARVVILGAGGSARAILFALIDAHVHRIAILNRTIERAEALAKLARAQSSIEIRVNDERAIEDATLIVNTTPDGKLPDSATFPRNVLAFDLVYRETDFLRAAKRAGAKTIDGLGMLVHQGARSLELWTEKTAPARVMGQAVGYRVA